MRTEIRVLVFAGALALVVAPARAQFAVEPSGPDTARSWITATVRVQPGRTVVVAMRNGSVEGVVIGVDDHSITIAHDGTTQTIRADDICHLRYANTRKRHVVYGVLIGAAAGAVIGPVWDQRSVHPSSTAEGVEFGSIIFGAPVGALIGALIPHRASLYERAAPACR